MKIFVTGATGLIGTILVNKMITKKYDITILSRNIELAFKKFGSQVSYCDSLSKLKYFDGYDAVINLAGESIANKRWTSEQKQKLIDSRLNTTSKIVELIKNSNLKPSLFISGSAIGYYGNRGTDLLTESASVQADSFTHQLCANWENMALKATSEYTRVCILRTGIVLSRNGGMLPRMLLPFKVGLGGIMGKGTQYMAWIHINDMVEAILYLLLHPHAEGAFNISSPQPITNKMFSVALAKHLHRPCWFTIPSFILKLFLGELSSLLLDSQKAIPRNLDTIGFKFKFDNIDKAFNNLLSE